MSNTESLHKNHVIWQDGEFIPWSEGKIHCLAQTTQYGYGVFEGVRCYETASGPAIFHLEDHTNRLFHSAKILNIEIPFSKTTLNEAQIELIRRNGFSNAYIRPTVYLDNEFLGLHTELTSVHVVIAAIEWNQTYNKPERYEMGVRLMTSSYVRSSPRNGLNQAKACGMYLITLLAGNEAKANGFDDALMLDETNHVAEGNASNIFMVKNGTLITPFTSSALNGITRKTIIELAKKNSINCIEKQFSRDELYTADEAFLTGTAAEILPIQSIDRRLINDGKPGPITKQLMHEFKQLVHSINHKNQTQGVIA